MHASRPGAAVSWLPAAWCSPLCRTAARTVRSCRRSAGTRQRTLCQESLMRCPERLPPGWCAAVHGGVNQYLLDLVDRYARSDRALHIDAQLVGPSKRRQDRKIQHAPCLAIQTRPAPRVPPRPLSHDALKGHHELVGISEVRVDVLSAQDLPPRLEAPVEQFALGHGGR